MKKLIEIKNLSKYFNINKSMFSKNKGILKAVDNISFDIKKGETLGLVGESGCGKSTLGRTILKLYDPTSGQIIYKNTDISTMKNKEIVKYRKHMQMIFQDPYASLNPRFTVGDIVGEAIDIYRLARGNDKIELIKHYLNKVGLNSSHISRYPHEFSGGQRQRIGIARALAVNPEFIVCDEPISALDVSIQAQVINMLEDLQEELGLTYLFIAHDLSMVKHISTRIGIMYLGKLVEISTSNEIYYNPVHPYTKGLLSAIPVPDPKIAKTKQRIILEGDIQSPIDPPKGCRFCSRCKYSKPICKEEEPQFKEISKDHFVACHNY